MTAVTIYYSNNKTEAQIVLSFIVKFLVPVSFFLAFVHLSTQA